MAELTELTPRQEQFAQAYVETGVGAQAYRQAYPRSRVWQPSAVHCAASKMLAIGKVSKRVEELNSEARRRNEVTVDSLTADFRDAIEFAKKCGNPSAVVSALVGLMKLHGLGIERKEVTVKDDVRRMSKAELEAYEKDIEAQLAALNAKH